ncbi:hypothetical protein FB446DRAFT_708027 [Lentinula raphanica]|nr:hypothetical protein FB446DRAFT_708027 [Lentinula raphanica]KAJ3821720.1 hypothetical protein F5880DRAFT_1508336 [Lentinula raphanica]
MARRSHHQIFTLYAAHKSRATSVADGFGYLYAFVDRGHRWKIGVTNNFARRKREWDRQCPSSSRRWMPPITVKRRRRAETLAHLLLELLCSDRPRIYCPRSHVSFANIICRPQDPRRNLHILCEKIHRMEDYNLSSASYGFEGVSVLHHYPTYNYLYDWAKICLATFTRIQGRDPTTWQFQSALQQDC